MSFEVELKFKVDNRETVKAHLAKLASTSGEVEHHCDTYYRHPDPNRDFAQTHEAFRIRTVNDENCLTYKGPIVDLQVKVREEIEIDFASGSDVARQMDHLLTTLGFRPRGVVRKTRISNRLHWDNRDFTVTFDDVEGLGSYMEVETIAGDEEAERLAARDACLRLATYLGLSHPERRSYLTMVLEKGG
ncbi:MAG: class IV adenylate cyclase [Planctomycetota bacterium]|nr:class IV adenylate cyclase [Planctomycetota bacterium]MDA1212444.1 class IV adenylate cyclase [Planctomycetota bacterium]